MVFYLVAKSRQEANMRDYVSRIVYEIVDGVFVYRGWDVVNGHMPETVTPQRIRFGRADVELTLVDDCPKLEAPLGNAKLIESNHAFKDDITRVEGRFVEVLIT